jgi:hypothetical protein
MYRWPYADWAKAGFDAWALGMEASAVIGMRVAKIASGGDADQRETRLMMQEKMQAALELQFAMATGGLGSTPLAGTQKVLKHYQRKVGANRRRLGKAGG